MTIMIRFAVVIILTLLVFQPSMAEQFTIKVGVDLVNVLFTVTDKKGRLVSGLGPEDFTLEEDGEPQEIRYFARENELPLTLALLVDTSPSVNAVFDEEKRTAVSFLDSILREQDLALVIGFDRSVTLIQDFTESSRLLGDAVYSLEIGSGTSVYDAVFLANEDRLQSETGRKAVILISDGEDTTSRVSRTEALIAAHQADAVIYSISNSAPRSRGFFGGGGGRSLGDMRTLRTLSEETGGPCSSWTTNPISKIFSRRSPKNCELSTALATFPPTPPEMASTARSKSNLATRTSESVPEEVIMRQVKTIVSAALAIILSVSALLAQEFQIRTRVDLVEVPFSVKGRDGELVVGLGPEDFTVLEDGVVQTIERFSIDPVPLSAALVIDTGLAEDSLRAIQEAIPSLVYAFGPLDEVAVYRYDNEVRKMLEFTDDPELLWAALDELKEMGPTRQFVGGSPVQPGPVINGVPVIDTARIPLGRDIRVLHDAVFVAGRDLRTRPDERRKIIVLVSDGNDDGSEQNQEENSLFLMEQEIQIYPIGLNTGILRRIISSLDDYARLTGGDLYYAGADSLERMFPRVMEQARNQYVLTYISTNRVPPGTIPFRQIEVLCDKAYDIVHKAGYYQIP